MKTILKILVVIFIIGYAANACNNHFNEGLDDYIEIDTQNHYGVEL